MLNVRIITIMPKKLTTEEWINKARIKHGDKYDYSKSVYTGSRDRIIITCPKHGDFTAISGLHISRGDGCPECASLAKSSKLSLSNEEFINRLRDMFGDNYDYSKVRYTGNRGSVTLICPNHGEFNALVSTLSKGVGCLKCKEEERLRKFTDTYIQEFKKFHPELDYSKTVYTGWDTKVTITCPKHGDFEVLPGQFHKYVGCPSCSSSKGEGEICNVLLNEKIKFVREYTIQIPNEINTSGRAYIDFYLPEHNTFIEYNGIQHYEPEMAFGGTFKFEQQQARDEYVRQYCKDNDIKLIEIRYDEDVWEVLNEKLLNNNDK